MKQNKVYSLSNTIFGRYILSGFVMAVGLFHEFLSCVASVILCICLLILVHKNKIIVFKSNIASFTVMIISFMYLVSILWAVDPGMAFIGFIKFLPLVLFMLVVMQDRDNSDKYLDALPIAGVVMTVVSTIVMMFSPKNNVFAPVGRLSGFLEYSNTFALILLVSLVIITLKKEHNWFDFVCFPILIGGIIASGSRSVFVLMIISVITMISFSNIKRIKYILAIITAVLVVAAVVYALVSNNIQNIGRFLSISFKRSTFQGRILYYRDALPIALKNPFGTGFLGFYYLQQSIQTGLYSVRYVHNDFLQIALDIGWVPMILLIICAVRSFMRKKSSLKKRILLIIMTAHALFDMDFQFVSVFMIYILLLDINVGKEHIINSQALYRVVICATGCTSMYMCLPLAGDMFKWNSFSHTLYPWNTEVNIRRIIDEENLQIAEKKADEVLRQNKYVTVAYSVKAASAFSSGNIKNMIVYKDKAIANAPLVGEEYFDYIRMLLIAESFYINAGDAQGAYMCSTMLDSVVRKFNGISKILSGPGKLIQDQPVTKLPEELEIALKERKNV